mmetsp:Transcript_3100/g.12046  ORF Transcript_3100/g.12046 Transcript_3100/m.12046 type:complete len:410 (-) Transcript_3100:567-1796(-)
MDYQILRPSLIWVSIGGTSLVLLYVVHLCVKRYVPSRAREGGLARLGLGPVWLRYAWSTLFIFILVVPFFVLVVVLCFSIFLAAAQGWSYPDSFHFLAHLLGLTSRNLGAASDPDSTSGDVVDIFTALTGSVSMYVILGMAGMTTLTRRIALFAPRGVLGLLRSIFLYYPLMVALFASAAATVLCGIEGWPYIDCFLMACGWFSGVNLNINDRNLSSDQAMFVLTVCHIIAIAIKISVCQVVYANPFPRKVARWIDATAAHELDDIFGATPNSPVVDAMGFDISVDLMDVPTLKSEVIRLRRLSLQLLDENDQLKVLAEDARGTLQGFIENSGVDDRSGIVPTAWWQSDGLEKRGGKRGLCESDALKVCGDIRGLNRLDGLGCVGRVSQLFGCFPQVQNFGAACTSSTK